MAENCDIREAKRRAVRGLGLTSIKFVCRKRIDDIQPGMRVEATLPYVCVGIHEPRDPEDWGGPITEKRTLQGVAMEWMHGKVRVYIPEQPNGYLVSQDGKDRLDVIKIRAGLLRPTGEHTSICIHCGLPREANAIRWVCRADSYSGDPLDCEYAPDEAPGTAHAPCESPKLATESTHEEAQGE